MGDNLSIDVWRNALEIIRKELNSQSFETWFGPTVIKATTKNSITLAVPNSFFKDWLIEHYNPLIKKAVSIVSGKKVAVNFIVRPIEKEGAPLLKLNNKPFPQKETFLNPKY